MCWTILIVEGLLAACGEAEDRYRFSQDLYRRAIYDRMQNVRRRLLHREIGNALGKDGTCKRIDGRIGRSFRGSQKNKIRL